MLSLDDLRAGVDRLRGTVSFSVTLGAIPGVDGAGMPVQIRYDGLVGREATSWNFTAPTGPLGLGWQLPIERIVPVYPSNAAPAGADYTLNLTDGTALRLLATSINGDEITYVTDPYRFWRITRDLTNERWEIVREDGRRYVYGGAGTGGALDAAVSWSNWIGSSVAGGQTMIAAAWNLSRIVDLWGNQFTFTYRQVTQTVGAGGLAYTQATYFDTITGPYGDRAVFSYRPKTPAECPDPHTAPAPPNAWQNRVEKEYLDAIAFSSPTEPMVTVRFDYTDGQGHPVFLGSGFLTKRLLMGIGREYPGALAAPLPPARFTYTTDATSPAYGAIASVTTAQGGVATYTYTTADLPLCQRAAELAPPAIPSVTCTRPRFWFSDDYVVATWQRSDQKAQIVAYTWEGRWIPAVLGVLATADAAAYDALQVVTAHANFAVVAGVQCLPYQRSMQQPGGWSGPAAPITLDLTPAEPIVVAGGDGLAAVLGMTSGKLNRLRWTGRDWAADVVVLGGGGAGVLRVAAAARHNVVVSCWTDSTTATDPFHIRLDYLNDVHAWGTTQATLARTQALVGRLSLVASDAYAVLVSESTAGSQTTAAYAALWWSATYATLQSEILTTATAATVTPPALRGSVVAVGSVLARFDGATWTKQDIGAAGLAALSYGDDVVLRTTGYATTGQSFTAFVYDPNSTAATRWSSPTNLVGLAPGPGAFVGSAARGSSATTRWLLGPDVPAHARRGAAGDPPANALWVESADATWHLAYRIPTTLSAAELPSLQLLDDRYAIYQSGTNTIALLLGNGTVDAGSPIVLSGEQILVTGQPASLLVGTTAFITYTGTWGVAGSVLRLHRPVRGAVAGAIASVTVSRIRQETGYQNVDGANGTLDIACAFAAANATVNPSGWAPVFNLTSMAEGVDATGQEVHGRTEISYFNGLTAAEAAPPATAPVPPYPTDTTVTNALDNLGLVVGAAYADRIVPAGTTTPVAGATSSWWVYTKTTGPYDARCPWLRRSERAADGVPLPTDYDWNPDTGFASRTTRRFYDGAGQPATQVTEYRYFSEQYGHPELNLLNAIVQQTELGNGGVTAITITTWADGWGHAANAWAPSEGYVATTAQPATFNRWNGGPDPVASGWLLVEAIKQRTGRGSVKRTTEAAAGVQSAIFDRREMFAVAAFGDADVTALEAGYYGFESYEVNSAWSYIGGSIEALIVSDDAHTGRRCLRFPNNPPGSPNGPISTWPGSTTRPVFLFSCWMLVPRGSNVSPTNARWTLLLETGSGSTTRTAPFPAASGEWTYVVVPIDLTGLTVRQITIQGTNESNMPVYIDELRFSPIDAIYSASVYDDSLRRQTAQIGENGGTLRSLVDPSARLVARVGPDDRPRELVTGAFSRIMSGTGAFDPTLPNLVAVLASTSQGQYQRFGQSDAADWTLPANWAIQDWRLRFTGTAPTPVPPFAGPAQLTAPALGNFAARVRYEPAGTVRAAGIGLDNLIVYWDASAPGWILGYKDATGQWFSAVKRDAPNGADWMLAVIDGLVLFWADGNPIFAYPLTQVIPAGKLSLFLSDPGAFADLAIVIEPRLSFHCSDGAGQTVQQLDFADNQTIVVSGALTDVMRRSCVTRAVVTVPAQIPPGPAYPQLPTAEQARVNAGIATYLIAPTAGPTATGTALTIPQYLALEPPPFAERAYDRSPLGRTVAAADPGIAIGGGAHVTTYAYAAHTATDAMAGLGYDAAPGNYQVQMSTDPNGVQTYRLLNALGQALAVRVLMSAAGAPAVYETTQSFYDAAGRLARVLLPNAYGGATPNLSWAVDRTWTFVNQLASITGPDTGQTSYNYDELGRLRYQLDATGRGMTPQRIIYYLYDGRDRLIEEGTIQSAEVDFASIPQYAPYTLSHTVAPVWHRRFFWDRSIDDPAEPNLVGRLWRVEINNTAGRSPDAEEYAYDRRGNVVRTRVIATTYDGRRHESAFRYDETDTLVETTYPRPLDHGIPSGPAFKVGQYFDRLGRLVGIGDGAPGDAVFDPTNPITNPANRYAETYARYQYDNESRVTVASLDNAATPIVRAFRYDPASARLIAIDGDYHRETLTYEQAGYGGARYFDGTIASTANEVSLTPGSDRFIAPAIARSEWAYAYDHRRRLVSARNAADATDASLDLGTGGQPIGYDANGNLHTVPRPQASETYTYPNPSNQLGTYGGTATIRQNFADPATGWTWGASNGGPSASHVVDSGIGAGKALALAGGSLGHVEELRYAGYLDATGSFNLTFKAEADAAFAGQTGTAGWALELVTAAGAVMRVGISDLSTLDATWRTVGPVAVNVGALASAAGLAGDVVRAGLVLTNAKRTADGTPAGALYVTDIVLDGTGQQPLGYDAGGNVTAAPGRGLTQIDIEPVSHRTARIVLGAGEAQRVDYAYDGAATRLVETVSFAVRPAETDRTLYLRDPAGRLLMRRLSAGGTEAAIAYLTGPQGLLAQRTDTALTYLLQDNEGSTRVAVTRAGAGGTSATWFDYTPFGQLRAAAAGSMPYRFTGALDDDTVRLFDLGARLYDPVLRRFLQPDPLGADDASYAYAAGDPVGQIDPDGNYPCRLLTVTVLWGTAISLLAPRLWFVGERVSEVGFGETWNEVAHDYSALLLPSGPELVIAGSSSLGHAVTMGVVHDLAWYGRYTSASFGSTILGAVVVGGAGVAADAASRLAQSLLGYADAWIDWGWTSVTTAAEQALLNFVILGGGFPRVFPSHTTHVGSFVGPGTGGPFGLWQPGGVPVPPGSQLGGTTAADRAVIRPIGKSYGCHHCGTALATTPDHTPPNKLAIPLGMGPIQTYFPHCRGCWQGAGAQGPLMAATTIVAGRITYPNNPMVARPHAPDSFRIWRLSSSLPGETALETVRQHPYLSTAGLAAWYAYWNYFLYFHWWPWYWRSW